MNTSDSDGPLAKVSYFPGVEKPSESVVFRPTGDEPAAPPTPSSVGGWYVEPSGASAPGPDDNNGESKGPQQVLPAAPVIAVPEPALAPSGTRRPTRSPVFVETPPASRPTSGDEGFGEPSAKPLKPESPAMQKMRLLVEAAAAAKAESDSAATHRPATRSVGRYAPVDLNEDDESEDEDEETPESPEELAARVESISMSALTRKGMSSWEMAEKLRARDLDEEIVLNEVARLERVGLLDDLFLAETLVRTLQDRKGLGRSGITSELRRRHVDPDAIEEALAALDGDDEITRATEIAVKRAPQLRSLDTVTAKRRLGAFLMRKGYSGAAVSAAVSAALEPGKGPRFR